MVHEKIDGALNYLSSKTNNLNNNDTRIENAVNRLVSEVIPDWINPQFASCVSNFYGQAKDVIEFIRITLINSKKHDLPELNMHLKLVISYISLNLSNVHIVGGLAFAILSIPHPAVKSKYIL